MVTTIFQAAMQPPCHVKMTAFPYKRTLSGSLPGPEVPKEWNSGKRTRLEGLRRGCQFDSKLWKRMHDKGYNDKHRIFQAVVAAEQSLHHLYMTFHYEGCTGVWANEQAEPPRSAETSAELAPEAFEKPL